MTSRSAKLAIVKTDNSIGMVTDSDTSSIQPAGALQPHSAHYARLAPVEQGAIVF